MNELKKAIKEKARQLGFTLAGVTSSESLLNYNLYTRWLDQGMHGGMSYLSDERNRLRRADPKEILGECKSILVLAIPYAPVPKPEEDQLQIASYALGDDYHEILPHKLQEIVAFIEEQIGHPVPNRYYTDSGPILERELAQRAGLGWIGKNSMLINPTAGSTFFLAEILLGIELEPDEPFATDHCGTCTRCITACPTQCILPNRTIDARRCISYLTIENKDAIPADLRPKIQNWIFGCDVCQEVCPWNRFSLAADPAFETKISLPVLTSDLLLTSVEFNQRFKKSPIKRAKLRGYLRNLAIATGNRGYKKDISILKQTAQHEEVLVQEHVQWVIGKLENE